MPQCLLGAARGVLLPVLALLADDTGLGSRLLYRNHHSSAFSEPTDPSS